MATTITTISLTPDLMTYANDKKIKLSHLVQEKLTEMIQNDKVSNEYVSTLQKRIEFLQVTLGKQRDFIEAKGLMEEFSENVLA